LSPAEEAELRAELASDEELAGALASLDGAVRLVRKHGPMRAPDAFLDQVLAAVAHEPMPVAAPPWWRRPFGVPLEGLMLAATALIVVGVALTSGSDTEQNPAAWSPPAGSAAPPEEARPAAARVKSPYAAEAPTTTASSKSAVPAAATSKDTVVPSTEAGKGSVDGAAEPGTAGTAEGANEAPAAPVVTDPAPGAGDAPTQWSTAGYHYVVHASDPAALAQLQRLTARHQGALTDASGAVVTAGEIDGSSAMLTVTLPNEELLAFGDDLRALGLVEEHLAEPTLYPGSEIPVTIELRVAPPVLRPLIEKSATKE
jgi:hypothetical protein